MLSAYIFPDSHRLIVARNSTPSRIVGRQNPIAKKRISAIPVIARERQITEETKRNGTWDNEPTRAPSVPSLWSELGSMHSSNIALEDMHADIPASYTYQNVAETVKQFASGLQNIGVEKNDKVCLFAENSARWLLADQAIMLSGGVDVVRGSQAPVEELRYIQRNSESCGLVVQDMETLAKLLPQQDMLPTQKFAIVLYGTLDPKKAALSSCPVYTFDEVLQLGQKSQDLQLQNFPTLGRDDLATLVYTSGTTGHPKGVKLTHGNLLYQIENLDCAIKMTPGDTVLCLLPPWHIYQRTCLYYSLSNGCRQVLTSVRKLRDDLNRVKPDHFVCVPLVLDTLHGRVLASVKAMKAPLRAVASAALAASILYVQARRVVSGLSIKYARTPVPLQDFVLAWLATTFLAPLHWLASQSVHKKIRDAVGVRKTIVSGGGSLSPHLDDFFEAIGLPVLNGWGLTETSPVLACRSVLDPEQNIRGTVGLPLSGTEVRVVDPETFDPVPDGTQGLVLARGPGVMSGYHSDLGASASAFRAGNGWFDTGDLGWLAPAGVAGSRMAGHIVLTGRVKDTIVLSSGKNVEPQPIEDACQSSDLVKHILLFGQDKRELGALVFPDSDALKAHKATQGTTLSASALESLFLEEVAARNKARADYQPFQHIAHVIVVQEPLSVEDGTLTRTLKPRRQQVAAKYAAELETLMRKLRG